MTRTEMNAIIRTYSNEEATIIEHAIIMNGMIGTRKAPETIEEFAIWCHETVENAKAAEAERAAKKAKAEAAKARKIEKDMANGITPEMRKAMNNVKKYEREIARMEAEIAEMTRKMNYWKKVAEGNN